jgi:hypothetical protein
VDSYDLDDDPEDDLDRDRGSPAPAAASTRRGRLTRWWPALVVLAVVTAVALYGVDQRDRDRELEALLVQVEQGQAAVRYSDARVQAMVQYTSPQLLSARAPDRVRASLRALVQQAAADRLEPMRRRRDAVAQLPVADRHGELRRARAAYVSYLDERISVLRAVSTDLRALYQPQTKAQRLLTEARADLLAVSSEDGSTERIEQLLR